MKNKRLFFSGGALYKTLGNENKYYRIVEYILSNYADAVFWYAGEGDSSEIDKLIDRFPGRVFHTKERKDLIQVLERCYLYLSTYPVCGGLMFQYAAKAGKIPVTLKNGQMTDGFLLDQEKLGIEFDSLEDLYKEIDKLMTDEKYHDRKEKALRKAIISPEKFNELVEALINEDYSKLPSIHFKKIDTKSFQQTYLNVMSSVQFYGLIPKSSLFIMLKHTPTKALYIAAKKFYTNYKG